MKIKYFDQYGFEKRYGWKCPGCKGWHVIPTAGPKAWGFNGSLERPTFTPSINQWTAAYEDAEIKIPKTVCHFFITDGKIQFLGDCTHMLANKTVEMEEI